MPQKNILLEKIKKRNVIQTKDVLADLDSADLFNATHYYGRWKKIKTWTEYAMKNLKMYFSNSRDIIMLTSPRHNNEKPGGI